MGAIRNISGINVLLNNIALKADATLGVAAGSLEVKGALYEESGSRGLAKAGSGLLILSGGNSYSGVTRVNLGTLRARHISALGAGGFSAQTLTMVAPGAALEFEGSLVVDEHIHFAGTGISGLGALRSLTGVNALTNNIAMDGDASVYVETGSLEMRGVVYQDTGTPLFRKTGPALLVFTGDNGISGVTEVAGGTLRVKHNHALGTGGFDLQTLTRVLGGAALELEGSISIDEHLHVAGSGPTTRGVIRNITGSNTVTGNIALDADSNVDVPGGSLNLPGIIYQETGAFGLGKWGVGKLTLAGGNSYGGITAIHEGTVRVMHNNGLGVGGFDGATLTNVSSGATLEFEGNLTVPEHTHIAGTGVEGTGALRVVQGTVVLTNHCALDARATIQVAAGASLTQATSFYSDVAAGVGFVKTGGGILRIDGGADVHGAISVQGGTLALGTATMNDAYGLSLSAGAHVNLLFSGDDTIASLTLGSDTLPPGRYNAASHPAWISGNGTLVVPGGSAYQTWIAGFPGVAVESRGPLDDPDGDSILNIVEFVLGGQPGLRDRNLVSAALIDTNGDGVKESLFSVAVPAGAVFNLQGESLMATWHSLGITVQGSQNLSAWSVPVLEVQPAVVPPGAHSLPAGYVWKSFRLGSAGALPKGFMRVLVTF